MNAPLRTKRVDPEHVRAFDEMVRRRPLKPPPLPREMSRVRSAGEIALEREKRMGMHVLGGVWFQ